jgi:hypothetical protein
MTSSTTAKRPQSLRHVRMSATPQVRRLGDRRSRQNPSSARPIQLTAKIDEAIAAKVTMVLTDRIPTLQATQKSCRTAFAQSRRELIPARY